MRIAAASSNEAAPTAHADTANPAGRRPFFSSTIPPNVSATTATDVRHIERKNMSEDGTRWVSVSDEDLASALEGFSLDGPTPSEAMNAALAAAVEGMPSWLDDPAWEQLEVSRSQLENSGAQLEALRLQLAKSDVQLELMRSQLKKSDEQLSVMRSQLDRSEKQLEELRSQSAASDAASRSARAYSRASVAIAAASLLVSVAPHALPALRSLVSALFG